MKHLLIIVVAIILCADIFVPLRGINTPKVDELETMLKNVEKNLAVAGEVTLSAQKVGEKMLTEKVAEKKALKEEVSAAKEKINAMTSTMLFMGVDTSLVGMEIDTARYNNMMRLNGFD